MVDAAEVILRYISELASPPTSGRSFLVIDAYGRGVHTPSGEAYRETLLEGLRTFAQGADTALAIKTAPSASGAPTHPALNVAFADVGRIWDGVLGSNPGYRAFGYTSTESCTRCNNNGCTMDGMCDDPEHYFYWFPG